MKQSSVDYSVTASMQQDQLNLMSKTPEIMHDDGLMISPKHNASIEKIRKSVREVDQQTSFVQHESQKEKENEE